MHSIEVSVMPDYMKEDPDFELWRLLYNTATMAKKAREKELRKYGISPTTAAVLDCVNKSPQGSPTPSQISSWIIREPQSTSGILNRMEKRGMIVKTRDPKRRNVVRVALTKWGEDTNKKALKRKSIHMIISTLSKEERQELTLCLKKIQSKVTRVLGK